MNEIKQLSAYGTTSPVSLQRTSRTCFLQCRLASSPGGDLRLLTTGWRLVVTRLDGELGGDAVLVGHWSVIKESGNELMVTPKSRFSEPTGSSDYEAFVSAMSLAIADQSQKIAEGIKAFLP